MTEVCPHCKALKFPGQTKRTYCPGGKSGCLDLQNRQNHKHLNLADTAESKHFLQNIRKYNSSFQMTSFGSEIETAQCMPTFKVKGQIYHSAGALLPFLDGQHKFLQMNFIDDDNNELHARCRISGYQCTETSKG